MRERTQTPQRWTSGPHATGLKVLEARPQGYDVQLELADGTLRRAWIPHGVVDDARIRLRDNQDLVAAAKPLGIAGLQAIALLAARPQEGAGPFVEVRWFPAPTDLGDPDGDDMAESPTELFDEAASVSGVDGGWRKAHATRRPCSVVLGAFGVVLLLAFALVLRP